MIGSNRGWIETPYVPCPATIDLLAQGVRREASIDAAIVPGVMDCGEDCDVMRGEEVQLLGALAAGLLPPGAHGCHPGTHTKWVVLDGDAIARLRTVMTGELFALLRSHSILAAQLAGDVVPGEAFDRGVLRSLEGPELGADLFGVRAQLLLGRLPEADAASYASGLLIGADIATGLRFAGAGTVALIGDSTLTRLYAAALALAGRENVVIDDEAAFVAGMAALARRL
jgi:2-dehydro-3-deoxygalactonokinase